MLVRRQGISQAMLGARMTSSEQQQLLPLLLVPSA